MSPQSFMYGVGVIGIVAGLGVLVLPRLARNGDGGQVFWDLALPHFGLMIAALALARLEAKYAPRRLVGAKRS